MTVLPDIVLAAQRGDCEEVIRLAQANPFVPAGNSVEPALLAACEFGQLSVVRACVLDLKCNPNCVDRLGRSPLHMAVLRKANGKVAVAILKFLTQHGANIRKSVLHVCANDLAIFPLVELGADKDALSVDGLTPIAAAVAADREEVVCELLRAGCRVSDDLIFSAKSFGIVHALVRAGLNVNCRNASGITPLQLAVQTGDKRLARILLEVGARPAARSRVLSGDESDKSGSSSGGYTRPASSDELARTATANDLLTRLQEMQVIVAQNAAACDVNEMLTQAICDWEEIQVIANNISDTISVIRDRVLRQSNAGSASAVCVICHSRPRSTVLLPCKHMCCCSTCAQVLMYGQTASNETPSNTAILRPASCPVCRSSVCESVNVYT